MSCAEMAEQIDLPFGLWTRVAEGRTSSVEFTRWCQCAHIGTTWQITIEPFLYGSDAVLCQITLTTCFAGVTNWLHVIPSSSAC